jgi:RimJ/RimL family protein N-acetyltransferase
MRRGTGKVSSMNGEITVGQLVLQPLTPAQARDIVDSDRLPEPLHAGDGWPHADSYDGLRSATADSYAWLITLERMVIGDCGTHGAADEDGNIEIGYGLAEPYRHRGYGGAIVPPLTAWLLARPEVRRVVAGTEPGNRPSYRVLERAGFRRTGASEGELRYAYP